MTETTQDTETFTVALTTPTPAVTCTGNSPTYGNGCALLKHYDIDNNGIISQAEATAAASDYFNGIITKEESEFVQSVYGDAAPINMRCAGCYTPPVAPAHGTIEALSYPTSVKHGANIIVEFLTHNIGGETGTFIARVYQGATCVGSSSHILVHAGDTTHGDDVTVKAPTSGTSVTYTLKLFLVT